MFFWKFRNLDFKILNIYPNASIIVLYSFWKMFQEKLVLYRNQHNLFEGTWFISLFLDGNWLPVNGLPKVRTGTILYWENCYATKCIVNKIQTVSVEFRSIIAMKNVDAQPGWWPVLTQRSRSSPCNLGGSKALTGSLNSTNFSLTGLLLDGKVYCCISVGIIRSSVDISSKHGIAKEDEKAGVTEHIITIP